MAPDLGFQPLRRHDPCGTDDPRTEAPAPGRVGQKIGGVLRAQGGR